MRPCTASIPRFLLSRRLLPGLLTAWLLLVGGAAFAEIRFVATSGNDSGNTCLSSGVPCKTITHALTQAVAGDTISVAAGTYNLALGETFPFTIATDLTLTGAGAANTILDATGANQRVITISAGTVTITGVRITGGQVRCTASGSGFCDTGGGIFGFNSSLILTDSTVSGNSASCINSGSGGCQAFGGGLRNSGTLTLTNSTVSGNSVSCTDIGTNECDAVGGGLYNEGVTTITNSTVSGNSASCTNSGTDECDAVGGGLHNDGALALTNSTVSGNSASCTNSGSFGCAAVGGGLNNGFPDGPPSTLTLTSSTITANTATCTGICVAEGGGLGNAAGLGEVAGTVTLENAILAKQLVGSDCFNFDTFTSNGFNLDSDSTCQLTQPSDHPGVSNPLLGPLQNNGGPTQTHALLPGSPAIDAGTNTGCPPTDQRGITRPQGGTCDIGAFEFGVIVAAVELTGTMLHTGQQITYQATLNPNFTPTQVDIYLGVLLPDGVTFVSFVPGPDATIVFAFGPVPVPFAANVTLAPTDVPFAYTFIGTEPVGTYFTYAGLAVAGSNPLQAANQLSVGVQAFQFSQ